MAKNKIAKEQVKELRFVSSGSKIWNQLVIFIILGVLPIIFPTKISVPNQKILFINLLAALATSIAFELWRNRLEKKGKDTQKLMSLQIITSVILLTLFLHLFTRINGPLYILYLLTVMESALNLNVTLPNIIVSIMMLSTLAEYIYLVNINEITFNFISVIEVVIRISSLIFMRSYGLTLAKTIIQEKEHRLRTEELATKLEAGVEELRSANIRLKEVDKLKDEFISIASHELRTPASIIKNYLYLLIKNERDLSGRIRTKLEGAYRANERSIKLINDMLDVQRIESGRITIRPERFNLTELTKSIIEELRTLANAKEINLHFDTKQSIFVFADMDRIHQVLLNLIDNAVKFTFKKGEVAVQITKTNNEKMAKVQIRDTGIGVSKENLPKLFTKFGKLDVDEAEFTETPGSGLGLYICNLLIKLSGGKITFDSELRKGSTVNFTLPIVS